MQETTPPMHHPLIIVSTGLLVAVIGYTAVSFFWGLEFAKSIFLGCIVFALPTLYFTIYAFRYRGYGQIALIARSFYWGQASKISLMAVGFALVFVFVKPLIVSAVFVGFCLMIPAQLLVATFISKSCSVSRSSAGQ